jgi:Invasin, domain 3/Protein of unknown function (DUF1566)
MQISAKKPLSVTARVLLFIGIFFSLFVLALTIERLTTVKVNSGEHSTLTPGSATITADGTSTQVLTVSVKDANGKNMPSGGADVAITKSSGTGTLGSVTDHGNGTYSATVTSPGTVGSGFFVATIAGAPVKSGTNAQTQATVTYSAGTATQIVIETAADGSGSAITAQSVASGKTFAAYAISRDAWNNFVANVAATWSLAGKSGGVVDGDFVAAGDGKRALFTAHLTGSATLQAVSGSLTDDAGVVTVTNGSASKLAFTTQPSSSTVSGAAFAQQPVVTIEDAAGNRVSSATGLITLTLTTGTGTLGGTLSMNAVNGVADFSGKGVNINQAGTDKVLTATATGMTPAAITPAFTITAPPLAIGDSYGGGKIAYILQSGDRWYVAGETHGLIAATADQSTGIQWHNGRFIETGARGGAIWTGGQNTEDIVASQGTGVYAAKLCDDLVLNGYRDWYLPSLDELNKLYLNRSAVGGFVDDVYWSSTEAGPSHAWCQLFGIGLQDGGSKSLGGRVRPVRPF